MSGMYDEVKISGVKLTPYPHSERGGEVSKVSTIQDLDQLEMNVI